MTDNEYVVYTGGCMKSKSGASAFVVLLNERMVHKHSKKHIRTTCNRIEMAAIIDAVAYIPNGAKMTIYSSSKYAIRAFENKCKQRNNIDLIELYRKVAINKNITLVWLKTCEERSFHKFTKRIAMEEINGLRNEQ